MEYFVCLRMLEVVCFFSCKPSDNKYGVPCLPGFCFKPAVLPLYEVLVSHFGQGNVRGIMKKAPLVGDFGTGWAPYAWPFCWNVFECFVCVFFKEFNFMFGGCFVIYVALLNMILML